MKIIVTAGGTSEAIDKVRKITNSSTGKLGMMITNELINRKDEEIEIIYYICSKESLRPINSKVKIIEIESTMELKNIVEELLKTNEIDYFVHSMAVSDYMVDYVTTSSLLSKNNNLNIIELIKNNKNILSDNKISSYQEDLIIRLVPTPKVISLIKNLSPKTYLVGFKLLEDVTEEELIDSAIKLRDKNKCDLVVANDLYKIRNGNHKAIIIDRNNNQITADGKEDISKKLVEMMFNE